MLTLITRLLAFAYIVFLSAMAIDVFNIPFLSGSEKLLAFIIHLTPAFLTAVCLAVAWKRKVIGGLLFLALAAVVTLLGRIPLPVFGLYPVLSLVTYSAYALDKSAAKKGTWRTQESTLHLLSLFGGWPGALLAQQRLRHKSSKQEFRLVFWVTVLMNCSVFLWLLTESGYQFVQGLAVPGNG